MSLEHEVGVSSGEIYNKLCSMEGYTPMNRLVKLTNRDPRVVALSLGWLLREGKVELRRDGSKLLVKVK